MAKNNTDSFLADIRKRMNKREYKYFTLKEEGFDVSSDQSAIADEISSILEQIVDGAEDASIKDIKERKERLKQLDEMVSSKANTHAEKIKEFEREISTLSDSIKMKQEAMARSEDENANLQIKKDIEEKNNELKLKTKQYEQTKKRKTEYEQIQKKTASVNKAFSGDIKKNFWTGGLGSGGIMKSAVNLGAIGIGVMNKDPLAGLAVKLVGDAYTGYRDAKKQKAELKRDTITADAIKLNEKAKKNTSFSTDDEDEEPLLVPNKPKQEDVIPSFIPEKSESMPLDALSKILETEQHILEKVTSLYEIEQTKESRRSSERLGLLENATEKRDNGDSDTFVSKQETKTSILDKIKTKIVGGLESMFPTFAGTAAGVSAGGLLKVVMGGLKKGGVIGLLATAFYSIFDVFSSYFKTGKFGNSGVEKAIHKIGDFFGINFFDAIQSALVSAIKVVKDTLYFIGSGLVSFSRDMLNKLPDITPGKSAAMSALADTQEWLDQMGEKNAYDSSLSATTLANKRFESKKRRISESTDDENYKSVQLAVAEATYLKEMKAAQRVDQSTMTAKPQEAKKNVGASGTIEQQAIDAMNMAGITNPEERAMFMAQMAHESGNFRTLVERDSGEKYEGRKNLGNTQDGDGRKFKGRGIIQLTGRYNYTKYGKMIGADLVNNPELAADPEISKQIAGAYWKDAVQSKVSDFNDIEKVTKAINGGLNGLKDRKIHLQKYKANETILASNINAKSKKDAIVTRQQMASNNIINTGGNTTVNNNGGGNNSSSHSSNFDLPAANYTNGFAHNT